MTLPKPNEPTIAPLDRSRFNLVDVSREERLRRAKERLTAGDAVEVPAQDIDFPKEPK